MELLSTWGATSHVGTDSEVIARLLDHLLRVEGLSVVEAATILTNPYQRRLSPELLALLARYRGARLDGPFAVVAGYCDGSDTYLIALTDRSKFRPILIGEDEACYYIASEENQIRNLSKEAKIWTPEPGSFFIASLNRGILEPASGRSLTIQDVVLRDATKQYSARKSGTRLIETTGLDFKTINAKIASAFAQGEREITVENVNGQRYIGIGSSTRRGGDRSNFKVTIRGYPGNCLANLNDGVDFEIFGNVADDLADTMHEGSVVVHGNVRDVAGQALQGGHIFIRGSAGNRLAIQMREYKHRKPFIVVGETVDDYLGEYMAGGVAVVLDLSGSGKPVLNYVGTGMVGGSIFVRGRVEDSQIGLLPQKEDLLNYIKTEMIDGNVSQRTYEKIANSEFPSETLLSQVLPPEILPRVKTLFFTSKYVKHSDVRRGRLSPSDIELVSEKVGQFFAAFNLPTPLFDEVMASEFTIIRAKEEKKELPVPPQEVPVEE
jgi:glutamate synthase domain-containing protein 3